MEQEKNHADLQEGFKEKAGSVASNWRSPRSPERSYLCFGLACGQEAPLRVKLLFRSGERFSFSYALLPLISLSPNGELFIRLLEFEVGIKGRGLQTLEGYLSHEQVEWIKESPSGLDDGNEDVFIEKIEIIHRED